MDNADLLKRRMALIGHALRGISTDTLWRWEQFKASTGLNVELYLQGGGFVAYRRKDDGKSLIAATDIRLLGIAGRSVGDPIPTGVAQMQDARSETVYNNYILTERERQLRELGHRDIGVIDRNYHADFGEHKLGRMGNSFTAGFKESLKQTIGVDIGAKLETEISTEFTQELSNFSESESGETAIRGSGYSIKVQPGTRVKVWAQRTVQPKKGNSLWLWRCGPWHSSWEDGLRSEKDGQEVWW